MTAPVDHPIITGMETMELQNADKQWLTPAAEKSVPSVSERDFKDMRRTFLNTVERDH